MMVFFTKSKLVLSKQSKTIQSLALSTDLSNSSEVTTNELTSDFSKELSKSINLSLNQVINSFFTLTLQSTIPIKEKVNFDLLLIFLKAYVSFFYLFIFTICLCRQSISQRETEPKCFVFYAISEFSSAKNISRSFSISEMWSIVISQFIFTGVFYLLHPGSFLQEALLSSLYIAPILLILIIDVSNNQQKYQKAMKLYFYFRNGFLEIRDLYLPPLDVQQRFQNNIM